MNKAIVIIGLVFLSGCSAFVTNKSDDLSQNNTALTSAFYASMIESDKPEISLLNLFFTNMPKGGDLHHHYSGSIYAETYLDWVKKKKLRINKKTLKIVATSNTDDLSVDQLRRNDALYRQLLTLWSDKDFSNHFHSQPPPDANFFNTFGYFGPISDVYMDVGLNIIKSRAISENVRYVESMLTSVGIKANDALGNTQAARFNTALQKSRHNPAAAKKIFTQIHQQLTSNSAAAIKYNKKIDEFVTMVETSHSGIDDESFTMRYQSYGVRVKSPVQVFIDLLSAYLSANNSKYIVGVNIVAPENNEVALLDYELHMQMFSFLKDKYPSVNRALHAGELTLGMVRPKDLLFHMSQALEIAGAQRIGHGIDLPYEENSLTLLKQLKQKAAIEINLSSNEFILGVKGNEHPYLIYSKYGVPMVISTDDSGVSRNNLSNQYVLLASRYKPSYATIKQYVYNSIRYSFLLEIEKQKLQSDLDKSFIEFESQMANLYHKTQSNIK